jgi:hypothetical protein
VYLSGLTITGGSINSATGDAYGDAIQNLNSGTLNLTDCTLRSNTASAGTYPYNYVAPCLIAEAVS